MWFFGRAGAAATAAKQGVKSLFAFWMGGSGAAPTTAKAGVKSLFAFWMGGGTTRITSVPVVPPPVEQQYTGAFSWEGKRTKRERLEAEQHERERVARKKDIREAVENVIHPPKPVEAKQPAPKPTLAVEAPIDTRPLEIANLHAIAAKAKVVSAEITARANLAEANAKAAQRRANDNLAVMLLLAA